MKKLLATTIAILAGILTALVFTATPAFAYCQGGRGCTSGWYYATVRSGTEYLHANIDAVWYTNNTHRVYYSGNVLDTRYGQLNYKYTYIYYRWYHGGVYGAWQHVVGIPQAYNHYWYYTFAFPYPYNTYDHEYHTYNYLYGPGVNSRNVYN